MKRKTVRKFVGSDAMMLETSETLHAMFAERLSRFEEFDIELNSTFATQWLAAINAARGTFQDTTIVAAQRDETRSVKVAMKNAVQATVDVLFFAQKAFPNDADRLAAFGKGKGLAHARKSQPRMTEFMDLLVDNVARYTAQLVAAGATPQILSTPAIAHNELRQANLTQNTTIKSRPSVTHQRIEALNTAFEFGKTVCKAAKSVFRNEPEIASAFRFKTPPSKKKKKGE